MVERSLSMWEVPGSIPGFSSTFSRYTWTWSPQTPIHSIIKTSLNEILYSLYMHSFCWTACQLQTANLHIVAKTPNLPGFEPGIFWSVVRRVIRCATRPLFEDTLNCLYNTKYLVIFCFKKIPSNRIWTSDLWISIESTTVHRSTNWAIEGSWDVWSRQPHLPRNSNMFN